MDTLNRRMFRKKGGGASGIMASGPELIKRFNGGTFSFGNMPPAITTPFLRSSGVDEKGFATGSLLNYTPPGFSSTTNIKDRTAMGSENPPLPIDGGLEKLVQKQRIKDKENRQIDRPEEFTGDTSGTYSINQTSQNILNKEEKQPKGKNLGARLDKSDPMPGGLFDENVTEAEAEAALKPSSTGTSGFDLTGTKEAILKEQKAIQNAYQSFNLGDIDKANILGDTYENHAKNFFKTLKKRPEEVTFEDVKDSAFDMLGYDKETRKEQLTEDQESSIWLNLMRAGLAMAAGESDNMLTNVAKGFSIGLEGYGKDMRNLTDDYREDINKYQTTMYQLLKDKKSENIAMNALDVQRKTAEFSIVSQFRGEQREDLLQKLNNEVTMRKLKIQTLSTLANFDLEKMKLDKSDAQFQKTMEINLAKIATMLPKEIQAAQAEGLVEIIDQNKPLTADNLRLTQKGIDAQFSIISAMKDTSKARTTDTMEKIKISGSMGGFGIKAAPGVELSESQKNQLGKVIEDLNKSTSTYQQAIDQTTGSPGAALGVLVDKFKPLYNTSNGKIVLDYNDLPTYIKNAIENGDEDTLKEYAKVQNFIINNP
tara:strand:+ start:334 stop:2121 length:1788 start_codon:yes stop_codon:yes gene_type:complete